MPESADYIRGVEDALKCVKRRQEHYELYRNGDAMRTHPATFAILDELVVFLSALKERAESGDKTE